MSLRSILRGWFVMGILLAGSFLAMPDKAAVGAGTDCLVTNLTHAGTFASLQDAVSAATPGDKLQVRGRCVGGATIDRNLTIVGKKTTTSGKPLMELSPVLSCDPPPPAGRVYAHSGTTLYRIDTLTDAAVPVGAFTSPDLTTSMLDIALDRSDRMIGVTRNQIFQINPNTGACTLQSTYPGSALNSLSFVPVSIAAPTGPEMLVAATATGDVVRIDPTGGTAPTIIGNFGVTGGTQVTSSGDLVYVKGVGIFATVDVGPASDDDFLASVDPANGWKATVIGAGTGFNKILGIAFWGGTLYGFVDDGATALSGRLIELDQTTGAGTLLQTEAIRWFGAGVTTEPPLIP